MVLNVAKLTSDKYELGSNESCELGAGEGRLLISAAGEPIELETNEGLLDGTELEAAEGCSLGPAAGANDGIELRLLVGLPVGD
mmetsp:Transcript_17295/g.37794  ORF Transcript_17295/g.37794 Transcript_17295/m.37794 type:complete len:84 (-) Transcript_17295:166-417(-)